MMADALRLKGAVRIDALGSQDFVGSSGGNQLVFQFSPALKRVFRGFRRRQVIKILAAPCSTNNDEDVTWEVLQAWKYDENGEAVLARPITSIYCTRGKERREYTNVAEASEKHGCSKERIRHRVRRETTDRDGWTWGRVADDAQT